MMNITKDLQTSNYLLQTDIPDDMILMSEAMLLLGLFGITQGLSWYNVMCPSDMDCRVSAGNICRK